MEQGNDAMGGRKHPPQFSVRARRLRCYKPVPFTLRRRYQLRRELKESAQLRLSSVVDR